MATRDQNSQAEYAKPLRRILVAILIILFTLIFLVWRIDSPRVERFRAALIDKVVPSFSWLLIPVDAGVNMVQDFRSYTNIYEQNQELRRELRQMRAWREAALQLEQENAKLRDLNKVRLDPDFTHITGVVLADSGSPFRQSVLLNVGAKDGLIDGWATTDGLGLVGRISGVGNNSARVILLTDSNSRLPVTILPSGQRAILSGNNGPTPLLDFVENADAVRPGDRVVSSGDGGVFPAGLLVGQVALGNDGRLRTLMVADFERLEFLRVLRSHSNPVIENAGGLITPRVATPEPVTPENETPEALE